MNRRARLAAVLVAATLAAVGMFAAGATGATQPPPTLTSHTTAATATPVDISGLDLHDGALYQAGSTYYDIGTEYGCGFRWQVQGTPWCGFGVSTAPSLAGPWSTPTLLFPPGSVDPWTGTTWQVECGGVGAGCFNPRMIQRSGWGANDGVWILWFNAPGDYARSGANAYYAMGCSGLGGPCGYGGPSASVHKPSLTICGGNGDLGFTPATAGQAPYLLCTEPDQTLSEERLSYWGVDGDGTGSTDLAGLTSVESPGAYQDPATGTWILTYSDRNCGYCEGTGTGYATASSPSGPWTAPADPGWGSPAGGRRDLSATSCGGQPRTVSMLDGLAYEDVDLWVGTVNEAAAGTHLEPLSYRAPASTPGALWQPFTPWSCS